MGQRLYRGENAGSGSRKTGYSLKQCIHKMWNLAGNDKWQTTNQNQLGYFCGKVYDNPRPITALESFFGVKNLAASITQSTYEAKRADVKKWRAKQDKEIFFD